MKDTGQQGDTALRTDVENMLQFMRRTDLPPRRRGVKAINETRARFGLKDDGHGKTWTLFEFKPTEAPELSTQTAFAKNTRIYFIKYKENEALGIVGIGLRSKQSEFFRSVKAKLKERS